LAQAPLLAALEYALLAVSSHFSAWYEDFSDYWHRLAWQPSSIVQALLRHSWDLLPKVSDVGVLEGMWQTASLRLEAVPGFRRTWLRFTGFRLWASPWLVRA